MALMTHQTAHGPRKLGAIIPKSRPKCLRFSSFYSAGALTLPEKVDYSEKALSVVKEMYLNDQYGDCVIADVAHQTGLWSANDSDSGGIIKATDAEVMAAYRIWNPGHQDNGCMITDVLDYRQSHGLTLGGAVRKIDGYVAVNYTSMEMVKAAILIFGSLTTGINCPANWVQSADGSEWTDENAGWQMAGGHDIGTSGYDNYGVWIMTWAGLRHFKWSTFLSGKYVTELYAPLSPNWYNGDKIAPSGFNVDKLRKDLEAIGRGELPPMDPDPTPPPIDPPIDPPVPPVPPAPVGPVYDVTGYAAGNVTFTIPAYGIFGSAHTVTFPVSLPVVGKAVPRTSGSLFRRIAWLAVIQDIKSLIADLRPLADKIAEIEAKIQELAGVLQVPYEDAKQVLRDLGIID